MNTRVVLVIVILVTGCQTAGTTDPDSIWFRIPPGSRLVLNQPLEIPAGRAHLMLQHGAAATAAGEFDVACRFEVRDLGPRTVQPDAFLIRRVESGQEWLHQPHTMQFYKVFHLQSATQKDILPMRCEYADDPLIGRPVTVTAIREALGNILTFEFAQ